MHTICVRIEFELQKKKKKARTIRRKFKLCYSLAPVSPFNFIHNTNLYPIHSMHFATKYTVYTTFYGKPVEKILGNGRVIACL